MGAIFFSTEQLNLRGKAHSLPTAASSTRIAINLSKLPFIRLFKKKGLGPEAFVMQLAELRTLCTVFQSIANLRVAQLCGYEAYIRGPSLIDLQMSQALLHAAKLALHEQNFELVCVEFAL